MKARNLAVCLLALAPLILADEGGELAIKPTTNQTPSAFAYLYEWFAYHSRRQDESIARAKPGDTYVRDVLLADCGRQELLAVPESTVEERESLYEHWRLGLAYRVAATTNTQQRAILVQFFYGTNIPPVQQEQQIKRCIERIRWYAEKEKLKMDAAQIKSNIVEKSTGAVISNVVSVLNGATSGKWFRTDFVLFNYGDKAVLLPVADTFDGIE